MNRDALLDKLGFSTQPLTPDGGIIMLASPFRFTDGDPIPIFIERLGQHFRFFDDGAVLFHLSGRGVRFDDRRRLRALQNIVEPHGVNLNKGGEFEILATEADAPAAFSQFVAALLAICAWEREQTGVMTDASLLIDEVALLLRSWKRDIPLSPGYAYRGVSGQSYELDFQLGDAAVIALGTHPATVGAAAHKLLDIRAASENSKIDILIVLDDRRDREAAQREGRILDSLGNVMLFSRLATLADAHPASTH